MTRGFSEKSCCRFGSLRSGMPVDWGETFLLFLLLMGASSPAEFVAEEVISSTCRVPTTYRKTTNASIVQPRIRTSGVFLLAGRRRFCTFRRLFISLPSLAVSGKLPSGTECALLFIIGQGLAISLLFCVLSIYFYPLTLLVSSLTLC